MRSCRPEPKQKDAERDAFGPVLLVELVLLLVLLDDGLVGLFKVFGEDDVSVLTHRQHAGLRGQQREPESEPEPV